MAIFQNISSPNLAFFIFSILTLAFLIFEVLTKEKYQSLVFQIYLSAILFSQFLLNINLTKELCGEASIFMAFIYTFIPWTMIFGIILLFLSVFPGWLAPFSNTFGYFLISMYKLDYKFSDVIIASPINTGEDDETSKVNQLLQNILSNKSVLINEIPNAGPGFVNFIEKLRKINLIQSDITDFSQEEDTNNYNHPKLEALQELIRVKFLVANIIWYILTGLLTISISYNSIIQSECKNSVKYIEKRYAENQQAVEKTNAENVTNGRTYIQTGD